MERKRFIYAIGTESDTEAESVIILEAEMEYSQEQFHEIIEQGIQSIIHRGNLTKDDDWFLFIEPLERYLKEMGFNDIKYQATEIGYDRWPVGG